jgi:alpha-tubulin suppressor-like RCC1 family protein
LSTWGSNNYGEGDADTATDWVEIAGGAHATYGIKTDANIYARGWSGSSGTVLGGGSTTSFRQISSPTGQTWVKLFTKEYTTCMLTNLGEAWCIGDGVKYQLGQGTSINSATPVKVTTPAGRRWKQVAPGEDSMGGILLT